MDNLTLFIVGVIGAFIGSAIVVPFLMGMLRGLGLYTIVNEGNCHVYVLFGRVLAVLREPGLHFLLGEIGPAALIINWIGKCYVLDMRLDQRYLRSQPVNSEEGAPMGIGAWYEMAISDPVAYLFKNADPQGSLAANVSNTVVRTLSNMPLEDMLEDRHPMSQAVRAEVSPKSNEWGYKLGSIYIRKVHFRDQGMIRQIEGKVVNRLLDGFEGHLTTSKYARIAKCSNDTALRDIRQLVEWGILVKNDAGGRSTNYRVADD